MIPGEPLPTGALPRTRVIPKAATTLARPRARVVIAQSRAERERQEWPHVDDTVEEALVPGYVVFIRTRWGGIKNYRIRMVSSSQSWANKGRPFFVGTDSKGLCHTVWADTVVSVQKAITARRDRIALGP